MFVDNGIIFKYDSSLPIVWLVALCNRRVLFLPPLELISATWAKTAEVKSFKGKQNSVELAKVRIIGCQIIERILYLFWK